MNQKQSKSQKPRVDEEALRYGKSPSRPKFTPKPLGVGVYMELYEALPRPGSRGPRQLHNQSMSERVLVYLQNVDIVSLRMEFRRRSILKGCIPYGFFNGMVLGMAFNTKEDFESFLQDYQGYIVSTALQETLVTDTMLEKTEATKIAIRAHLWKDEVENCRKNFDLKLLGRRIPDLLPLEQEHDCLRIISDVKKYQVSLEENIKEIRKGEMVIEENLKILVNSTKKVLPRQCEKIVSFGEFQKYLKSAADEDTENSHILKLFLSLVNKMYGLFDEIESKIVCALEMIPIWYENNVQGHLKKKLNLLVICSRNLIKSEGEICDEAIHYDWKAVIPHHDHRTFLAPYSVLPLCLEGLVEIDAAADEYLTEFHDKLFPIHSS